MLKAIFPAVLLAFSYLAIAQAAPANRLHIPPILDPMPTADGAKHFDLILQTGEREFHSGKPTRTWGINGPHLGPTLRVRTGEWVSIAVRNSVDETTTLHWHGMDVPAAMDGGPHQAIEPGMTWTPHWTVTNEAATLWYHPHLMGRTATHVYKGLTGLFLIDDARSDRLAIPKSYGIDDIPVIVQDRSFDADGQFVYDPGLDGFFGNTILVNGTPDAFVELASGRVRLRLLNASNARRYDFAFSDGRSFTQIASDGGFLPAPVEQRNLTLAPGERAEILIDLAERDTVRLVSKAIARDGGLFIATMLRLFRVNRDEGQMFDILELRATTTGTSSAQLPTALNEIARLNEQDAVRTRRFVLDESHTINDLRMDHARIDEVVKSGSTEIWEIEGDWIRAHPFHIHAVQFQVLSRDGVAPPAHEEGWKDTIIVGRDEIVRLIMRFPEYDDPDTPYMYHCHLLEHEDGGMMGQFLIVADPSAPIRYRTKLTAEQTKRHKH